MATQAQQRWYKKMRAGKIARKGGKAAALALGVAGMAARGRLGGLAGGRGRQKELSRVKPCNSKA